MPSQSSGIRMRRKIGMAFEANAQKIEILALVPVGGGPDCGDGVHDRIAARPAGLSGAGAPAIKREQVVVDLEARLERKAVHRA